MVVSAVFSEWPDLERLEAFVDVDNKGSQRVLEKTGFLREGILRKYTVLKVKSRDLVIFSFLRTDSLRSQCSLCLLVFTRKQTQDLNLDVFDI